MVQWTKEQEEAIYKSGSDILVAAAAGSGKTAVLVERIIQKLLDKENPIDIDSLLVVTFTNASAQEMRNRIGEALEKALAENPSSMHLKKQLSLLQRASISTLHSFCLEVVRKYAYLLEIDPAFRIADDLEIDLIKQDVLDELFEKWYALEGEEQENFFQVIDCFSSDRSDVEVENMILDIYHFAIQNPWPDHWLDQLADVYQIPDEWKEADFDWLQMMKKEVNGQLASIQEHMQEALRICLEPDGPYNYTETVEADLKDLQTALDLTDSSWDELQTFFQKSTFSRLSGKKMDCNEEKKKQVKAIREDYKKQWNQLKNKWFKRNLMGHLEDMQELAPVIKTLTELVKQFKERFTAQKREKAIVDFSDLEHLCLQILIDETSEPGHFIPSQTALEYQKQFTEVLVDEYQDTNLVQETILNMVTKQEGPGNMFMVGDVKQSIYRFRHAEPSLFIDKYKRFSSPDSLARKIDLARNFRSRKQVLDGANYIFRQILNEELGEMDYSEDAELIYGNKMYDDLELNDEEPELVIIDQEAKEENDPGEDEEDYQELQKAQLEGRLYAKKIKSWIGTNNHQPLQVYDKEAGRQRNIKYRDIVILLRSMTWAATIEDELKKQGIPVYAELSTGYFEAIEVKVMISVLKVIDNPRQDIPLASVLKSPIVGLNEDELATIRLEDRHGSFYDALKKYSRKNNGETADKVSRFLKQLEKFRFESRQGALSELIWNIYRTTGYYDFVGGMPGGRQRQANLRALYDRARGYESTSFRGLFRFLRFIERMEERGDDLGTARALSEQEDVVRIMTIHKSKGLEFPVVILGAMDKKFNMQDLSEKYLLHKDKGLAVKYIDPVKRVIYPTLYYHAIQEEKKREMLAEEMRVLYVALTRAKEKLVMVGTVSSFEKKREKWQSVLRHSDWVLPTYGRKAAKTYLDWVGAALIRHRNNDILRMEEIGEDVSDEIVNDESTWKVSVIHASELANLEEKSAEENMELKENLSAWKPVETENSQLDQLVEERLSFAYPYEQAVSLRAKQTVTELKRQRQLMDEYSSDQLVRSYTPPIVKRPAFMQKEKTMTAAEKGTAMHTMMQHLPLNKVMAADELEEYAQHLVEKEILTKEETEVIDFLAIEKFFETDLAERMIKNASAIYREVPFNLTLPASSVYADWENDTDEQVLLQGVIDCIIPDQNGWIILDYKTDAIDEEVTDRLKEKLMKRYETQLSLYRYALEKIWKQPVTKTYLYFFAKQLILEVPAEEKLFLQNK